MMPCRSSPQRLRIALWALLLFAGHAVQVVAATHWHARAKTPASVTVAQSSPDDSPAHDRCLLCQALANTGAYAPPPAPWVLHVPQAAHAPLPQVSPPFAAMLSPSHAWRARAPPQV